MSESTSVRIMRQYAPEFIRMRQNLSVPNAVGFRSLVSNSQATLVMYDPAETNFQEGFTSLPDKRKTLKKDSSDSRNSVIVEPCDMSTVHYLVSISPDFFDLRTLQESLPVMVGHELGHYLINVGGFGNKDIRFLRKHGISPRFQNAQNWDSGDGEYKRVLDNEIGSDYVSAKYNGHGPVLRVLKRGLKTSKTRLMLYRHDIEFLDARKKNVAELEARITAIRRMFT